MSNPIIKGWYADPEARYYEGRYWIYATCSYTGYRKQRNLEAFSSKDLVHWTKWENIVDMSGFPYIYQAVWAPTILAHKGKYYLIFASNDIQSDEEPGGLEIAVADHPEGPFRAYLGHPLVDRFINGAQPIDAHLFRDEDGRILLYYGGWSHCNVAVMNDSMDGFIPFPDGNCFREITPPSYVEGPCMMKRNGTYYFMWSSGNWMDGSYRVSYAKSKDPLSGFTEPHVILQRQEGLAEGPGHHGLLQMPGGEYRIVYHRRRIGDLESGHRELCIDKLEFDGEDIKPVTMT